MNPVSLSALYGAQPLFVWVEDEATRVALSTAWAGDPIAVHVGGSNVTIRAVAEDAWRSGIQHVFGIVDRDAGKSNYARWGTPTNDLRTYILRSPEIENLVLDPKAIAGCAYNTGRRSEAEITAKLSEIVSSMTWWMACCGVLAQVREKRNEGFPAFPSTVEDTMDLSSALTHIMSSEWFGQHASRLGAFATISWLTAALQQEEQRLSSAVAAGTWNDDFSGKQILRRVSDFVYTKGAGKGKHTTLLQAIIQQQVDTGTVAGELMDLRASLRSRVGLHP